MKTCKRCENPKPEGRGRRLCDYCRQRPCLTEGCNNSIHANDLCKSCHQQLWRAKDKSENEIPSQFWYDIKHRYNLTPEEYEGMLKDQNNVCLVCEKTPERWCVDHDHSCCPGKRSCGQCIRGLLCYGCNRLLGYIESDPDIVSKAQGYLLRRVSNGLQ